MKRARGPAIGVVIAGMMLGFGVTAASGALVDDFSDATLSEYTLTKVLDQGAGTSNISFTSPAGSLAVGSGGTTGAEQVLFLRDDVSLSVGDMLVADVLGISTGWDRDLGIAVGYTKTPAGLGNPVAGDVRSSYVEVAFRSNNQVVSFARNGASNLTSGQEFAGTLYTGVSFSTANPLSLYVARVDTNKFEVGWMQNGLGHPLTANGGALNPYTITDANVPGAAVGFYADLRADLPTSPVSLDNLRIVPIPEPATVTGLALIGSAWAIGKRKR